MQQDIHESIRITLSSLREADAFTDRVLKNLTHEECLKKDGLHSDLNWQLGHVILSKYFLGASCVFGHLDGFRQKYPLRDWGTIYGRGSNPTDNKERVSTLTLLTALSDLNEELYPHILTMTPESLHDPALKEHPRAKTKRHALQFAAAHQMWHNGQMALIRKHTKGDSAI
jgi:hypothetical protein